LEKGAREGGKGAGEEEFVIRCEAIVYRENGLSQVENVHASGPGVLSCEDSSYGGDLSGVLERLKLIFR